MPIALPSVGLSHGLVSVPAASPSFVTAAPYSGTSLPSRTSVTMRRGGLLAVASSAALPWKSPVSSRITLSSDMSKGSVSCWK